MDITVITPSLIDRAEKLAECRQSVLAQTYPVYDHLVMTDKDLKGPAWTRNQLALMVETEWIAFLDDDDLLLPNHFELHKEYQHTADVIFSWGEAIHPDGGRSLFDSHYNEESILSGHNTIPVTATVRTSKFREVNGFPENERFEDWGLWKRLILAKARFQGIEEITWHYRIFPENRNGAE